jgi:hypothetical protein
MRMTFDVLVGAVACGAAYYLALPGPVVTGEAVAAQRQSAASDRQAGFSEPVAPARTTPTSVPAAPLEAVDDRAKVEQRFAISMLRNEIIGKVAEDMHRRGDSVVKCLAGVRLAGAERLRFSVTVVSTALEATTGRWRFVEIAEGEPLPESFAACAERAFGGDQHVAAPNDVHFPDYRGDLVFLYTLPASDGDEPAGDQR